MRKLLLIFLHFNALLVFAQTNVDYQELHVGGNTDVHSGLDLSPDGKIIAIAGTQGKPLLIYDWQKDQILKEYQVANWYGGAKVRFSAKGNYLLLQQTPYNDKAINKDNLADFEIIDVQSGKIVQHIKEAHAVKIANSETKCLVLKGQKVTFYNLQTGENIQTLELPSLTNSVALSADESILAISHKPTLEQVKNAPTIRNDKKAKKAIKPALKYREIISFYDAKTFQLIATVNELYDVVYRLQFSKSGNELFVYSIPHTKMQTSTAGRQGYVHVIDVASKTPARQSYLSLSPTEPDFMENNAETVFGIVSFDKYPEIRLYNSENGRLLEVFNLEQRLGDAFRKKMMGDGRASFTFLPNNSVFIISGNQAVIWKPEALLK